MPSLISRPHLGQPKSQYTASIITSPLGDLWIRHNHRTIFQLQYISDAACDLSLVLTDLPHVWQEALQRYFAGDFAGDFDQLKYLPIGLDRGTPFQHQVWLALADIPVGKTLSYLQLAQQIDRPKAVRAVGQALKRNPLAIILPCHRIIQQSGKLGGYAGQTDIGTTRKQYLLQHEGVILN